LSPLRATSLSDGDRYEIDEFFFPPKFYRQSVRTEANAIKLLSP
jgi:hypothetical protein